MKQERKIRRLKHLVHKYDIAVDGYQISQKKDFDLIAYFDMRIKSYTGFFEKHYIEHYKAFSEIKKLYIDLSLTKEQYFEISKGERKIVNEANNLLTLNNLKETRDNKGVYVGSGWSNANKIRYPKKTRSKRTWKIFYEMFPEKAKQDNWNGETSKKMK